MTCATVRIEEDDRTFELFRCNAQGAGPAAARRLSTARDEVELGLRPTPGHGPRDSDLADRRGPRLGRSTSLEGNLA